MKMEKLAPLIKKYRYAIIAITTLVTIGFAAMLPRLKSNDDMMRFLPQENPNIQLFNKVNERFGGIDVAIIGLESDTMFTAQNIGRIRRLTRKLAAVDGVYDVLSFTEVPNPQPSPEGLRVTPLVMDRIPATPAELAALRKAVLTNTNAVGNLISPDGKAAMVLCFLGGSRPRINIASDIQKAASVIWGKDGIFFAGAPFVRLYIAGGMAEDLATLTPVVIVVVLLFTFILFRRMSAAILALGTVGIAVVWVMGTVALGDDGITLVGSSLPTVLVSIGGAYGMHVLGAFFGSTAQTVPERIARMYRDVGLPVIISGITTAAGFMTFLLMDIAPLREFGVQAAVGVMIATGLSLSFIPALLTFYKKPPASLRGILPVNHLEKISALTAAHPRKVFALALLIAAFSAAGIQRIAPDATMETFFARNSQPDRANRFLERHFGGANYLQIYFEGDLRSPFVLRELQKLVEYTRSRDEVAQVSAITDSLIMMNEAMGGRADIPLNNRRAGSLYPFLEGTAAIDQMISAEKNASLIQIRLKAISAARVKQLIDTLREFIRTDIPRSIRAVQIGPFAIPETAAEAYSSTTLNQKGESNSSDKPESSVDQSLSLSARHELKKQVVRDLSHRLLFLARIHSRHPVAPIAQQTLFERIWKAAQQETLAMGPDLVSSMRQVIKEHIEINYAFLEPDETSDAAPQNEAQMAAAQAEWQQRADLVFNQLTKHGSAFIQKNDMKQILESALPITSHRDPEGLDMTAGAMAQSFAMERAVVQANRLMPSVLNALHISEPDDSLKKAIRWALTDLQVPVYGVADGSRDATPISATVTGAPVTNITLCESTISNQLKSLTAAIFLLLAILLVAFRSFTLAIKGMTPPLFMLIATTGILGAFKVPIDMSTSMIATIALGIGVDYTVHFMWRRRGRTESLVQTTRAVGPSILANAIQVAAGFSVLCFSGMIPMQRFGLLIAVTMILAALATFVFLPALLRPNTITQRTITKPEC